MNTFHNWGYLRNPFIRPTRNSFQRLIVIANDHLSKLEVESLLDPQIDVLYQRSKPLFEQLINTHQTWLEELNDGRAHTKRIDDLLSLLSQEKVEDWDVQIRAEVSIRSAEYQHLMREGRSSFYNGKKDIRIQNVLTLANALKRYPNLSSLQSEVETYGKNLKDLRNLQQQHEKLKRRYSSELHRLKEEVCTMMFRNLGSFIDLYPNRPDMVVQFFQMDLIRTKSNSNRGSEELEFDEELFEETNNELEEDLLFGFEDEGDTT